MRNPVCRCLEVAGLHYSAPRAGFDFLFDFHYRLAGPGFDHFLVLHYFVVAVAAAAFGCRYLAWREDFDFLPGSLVFHCLVVDVDLLIVGRAVVLGLAVLAVPGRAVDYFHH